jgi:Lecithin:cholesterol acyltransferase
MPYCHAMTGRSMRDLVVVVPGILGSKLYREGSQIWGYRGMLSHPIELGRSLALRPHDTAEANGLITFPVHLPGLKKLDIYGRVVDSLTSEFELTEHENLVLFAYDWRRSCRESALELQRRVDDALQEWRVASGNEQAKVVLVCHSMGGLVARWYLDVLLRNKSVDHVRTLLTIGTPYRGAAKAAAAIVNGVAGWTGPTGKNLSDALRGFPSVYELLPRYDCVQHDAAAPSALENATLTGPIQAICSRPRTSSTPSYPPAPSATTCKRLSARCSARDTS